MIAYPYLWSWQHERGETEGRMTRPTCVLVAVRGANGGLTHIALLVITTQAPQSDRIALEVSDFVCRRAGLGDLKGCWIIVDEYNYDVAERSWYIGPDGKTLGRFSKAFLMKIVTAFGEASRKLGRRVDRTE